MELLSLAVDLYFHRLVKLFSISLTWPSVKNGRTHQWKDHLLSTSTQVKEPSWQGHSLCLWPSECVRGCSYFALTEAALWGSHCGVRGSASGFGLQLGFPQGLRGPFCPSGPPCSQPLRWTLATLFPVPFLNRWWGRKFQKRRFTSIYREAV